MSGPSPFVVRVYDKNRRRLGTLESARFLQATPRHNAQPTCSVIADLDDRLADDLAADGVRVEVDFRGAFLMAGSVVTTVATSPSRAAKLAAFVADDWASKQV